MRWLSALALLVAVAAGAAPKPTPVYPAQLPVGPGREVAARACLLCHGPQLIAQQHKDAAAWEKTLAQMEKWGAPVDSTDHALLEDYLLMKFGPRGAAKGPRARP